MESLSHSTMSQGSVQSGMSGRQSMMQSGPNSNGMTMHRQVMPPGPKPNGFATQQTAQVLENRLSSAEEETKNLMDHLNGLGFSTSATDSNMSNMKVPVSPYKVRIASNEVLKDNYETLVSRVCKMESIIQTLKLNLLNIQGEKDLKVKSNDEYEHKINVLKQTYEQTISRYKRDMEQMKEDLLQENDEKTKLKASIKELKSALEDASTTRAEASVTADELTTTKQKMQRRINELKEDCDREKSLRKSLEESHNTLMERVRDMEGLVESERREVKSLSLDCQNLRSDAISVREELKLTQGQRDAIERDYHDVCEDMERMKRNFDTIDSDKQVLIKEIDRFKRQYDDLIKQLEQTQVIVDQQKKSNKDLKEQNEHLTKLSTCVQSETEHIKSLHKKELEAERNRVADKERVEEEALQYKIKNKELTAEKESLEKRLLDGNDNITVSVDAGWQKRGSGRTYDSLTGHCSMIGIKTGKLLDFQVRSTTCRVCTQAKKRGAVPKDHDCRKNFEGSAKSMEPEMVVDMVAKARKQGINIDTIVGDDDTTTIARLRSRVDSSIKKRSDRNHVRKLFGNALYSLKKNHPSLSTKVISYLQKCFNYMVAQGKGNAEKIKESLPSLAKHPFGEHSNCDKEWCRFKENSSGLKYKSLPYGKPLSDRSLQTALEAILNTFAKNAEKLAYLESTQSNESFNKSVASKAPKSRHYGGSSSLNYRIAATAAQKNKGHKYLIDVNAKAGLSPGVYTKRLCLLRDMAARKRKAVAMTRQAKLRRIELKSIRRHVEQEYTSLNKKYVAKDDEYCQAAAGLEKELNSLRHQLQVVKKEKERAVKDKDNILDEVNQTVDSMIDERTKLQNEAQQLKIELDSQKKIRKSLEAENATLMERVSGFESQQATQSKIEKTMMEMMEQKNKLAYENGSLQTQVTHLTAEVDKLKHAQNESTKLKHLNDGLQNRYDKAQKELSDMKIKIQRLDSQLRHTHGSYETKEKDNNELSRQRDEAIKERDALILKIQDLEENDQNKISGLQKNLEDAKTVNKEIASTLEAVMSSHSHLQTVVEDLQTELGKKDSTITTLKAQKSSSQREWKVEMKQFEERMGTLREELKKERDKSLRRNNRDITEVRKQNDNLSTRNMELVKANTELRHKVTEHETLIKDLKDKIKDQKKRLEYLSRSKKDLEENSDKVRELKTEIEDLETLRDEYVKRNTEQGEMINTFMNQISSLQVELKQLAQNQAETNLLIQQRESDLEKERLMADENKQKYEHIRKQKEEIDRLRQQTENRLREAQDESTEISVHLQDAHDWFRNKFEQLQHELVASKLEKETDYSKNRETRRWVEKSGDIDSWQKYHMKKQEDLVVDTEQQRRRAEEEKSKAHAAVEKAKEMIRNSRESISRLADFANVADNETKLQLQKLQQQLQREKDHNKYLEMKHSAYKEASVRQMECLLKEFNG